MTEDSRVQPGWYPDPQTPGQVRYWDGSQWTQQTKMSSQAQSPAVGPGEGRSRRRGLKIALLVIGLLLLAGCACIAATLGPIALQGQRLDTESRAYVESVLPHIVSDWDQAALEAEASPEFLQATSDDEMDQLFSVYAKLGPMQSIDNVAGESHVMKYVGQPTQTTATYQCEVTFKEAPAVISFTLIKHGEKCQVAGFHVNSVLFLEQLQ